MSVVLAFTAAFLFSTGTYLVLQRKLSRIIVGLGLLSHGANTMMLVAGKPGLEPIIGAGDPNDMADPLTQAMALTTIVITFGTSALLLALAFRSWILTKDDEVENDASDVLIAGGGRYGRDVADEEQSETERQERERADLEGID
jgi:multicomponent Na+:H+ antiporter subunit C